MGDGKIKGRWQETERQRHKRKELKKEEEIRMDKSGGGDSVRNKDRERITDRHHRERGGKQESEALEIK